MKHPLLPANDGGGRVLPKLTCFRARQPISLRLVLVILLEASLGRAQEPFLPSLSLNAEQPTPTLADRNASAAPALASRVVLAAQSSEAPPALLARGEDALSAPHPGLEPLPASIWEYAPGVGFSPNTKSISVGAGVTSGIQAFGSHQAHDLAQASLSYGQMLGRPWGKNQWYRGNAELRLELFTGAQFSPDDEWFVGLTPHLRYTLATGLRLLPFVDIGAGVTATGIGPPDLSGTFEFNLQAGAGILWFIKDNLALEVGARYVHWSCAGINHPNSGLNGVTGMLALTHFF